MIILGIDPGIASVGYALLGCDKKIKLCSAGLIKTRPGEMQGRLLELHREINTLIRTWGPDVAAMERVFFAKNQKTALTVSESRGAILLTTALAGLRVYEYTPLEVKKSVTGDGRADKLQVKKMLGLTLGGIDDPGAADDVFDAAAIALTHLFVSKWGRVKGGL
ncbi:MAG: crossover junction endodeoxyribonuclease RuvC [Candidatus Sungiibacteriota bacterium]|uniref:Crossover junction endodeoxyribonuclease RuvC n=1 Tax=Candidatus Sungiibacteriota bacterium TaxID=2750080 RepID=A0A7T5UQB0_9BACT|nr:MAG: crossover junction endodeoxyribonuclease RuvC [Candidatus Sungbacteria bacterium]